MLKILIFFVAVFLGFQAVSEDQSENEVSQLEVSQIELSAEKCENLGLPEKCTVEVITKIPAELFEGLDTLDTLDTVNMSEEEQRAWYNRLKEAAEGLPSPERVVLEELPPEIYEGLDVLNNMSEEEWRAWDNELQKEIEDAKNGQRQRNGLESFLFELFE